MDDDLLIAPDAETTRLLLVCPDRPGLIATVSGFLAEAGLNIVDVDQHSTAAGRFFMRMVFDSPGAEERGALEERFVREIAAPFEMEHSFSESSRQKKVAVMVSREDHCLSDLLWRRRNGHLGGEIAMVISNHEDLRAEVEAVGLPFHHVPVTRDSKDEAERRVLELIGATAHYVTAELDAGPIIDQDVVRVGHGDEVPDLVRIGRDVERLVLARAVTAHLEDRVLVDGERTVVF